MKFSFQSAIDEKSCIRILANTFERPLETNKIFDGEMKGNTFRVNYTTFYMHKSGAIHETRKMPNCTLTGEIKDIGAGVLIEGSVTMVKVRLMIITIIFALVFIAVSGFFYYQKFPLKVLVYFFIPGYGLFFLNEFMRFQINKKEALEQFGKLFKRSN
jgi:hypothetical protein